MWGHMLPFPPICCGGFVIKHYWVSLSAPIDWGHCNFTQWKSKVVECQTGQNLTINFQNLRTLLQGVVCLEEIKKLAFMLSNLLTFCLLFKIAILAINNIISRYDAYKAELLTTALWNKDLTLKGVVSWQSEVFMLYTKIFQSLKNECRAMHWYRPSSMEQSTNERIHNNNCQIVGCSVSIQTVVNKCEESSPQTLTISFAK